MALGGKESGEPLNSEDMALLEAVAGAGGDRVRERPPVSPAAAQGGRARSRAQLQREHHRVARRRPAGRRPRRARRALEPGARALYGVPRAEAVGRRLDELFDGELLGALRAHRAGRGGQPSNVSALYRVPLVSRHADGARPRLVNVAEAPLRDVDGRTRRHHRHHRGHHLARAARGAAADLREDGLDRPARRRRRARGEHAAHRHLELHADAARGRRSGRSADQAAREDRAPDVPRRQDRQRPAQPGAAARRPTSARSTCTSSSTTCCRCSSTSSATANVQVRKDLASRGADRAVRSSTSCSRCS